MLLGSILHLEPTIELTFLVVDVESGDVRASQRVSGGEGEDIFDIVDLLTSEIEVAPDLPSHAAEELDRPARIWTGRLPCGNTSTGAII